MSKTKQLRLQGKDIQLKKPYSYGPYNKVRGDKQRIRITEGCVHNCPFCFEPLEIKIFGIPKIERNIVQIIDMNLLCKPEALQLIKELGEKRVKSKVVYYDLMCGVDHRFLTQEIAFALKKNRFTKIRLAWDWGYKDQRTIKGAIDKLLKAGFRSERIMIFLICNWRISFYEDCLKLDLCKIWNVQVSDCYFDGQISPHIAPIFWTTKEIKTFRAKTRRHNQLVNFKIDPGIYKNAKLH